MSDRSASGYTPSPRPTYAAPTLVRRSDITHHVWGDQQSGLVGDWLYASTDKVHVIEFGMAPGGWFRHSPAFRTVFAADEVLHVLSGAMLACNPQTGELVECVAGESSFFRKDTWHHVRAQGSEPLRVLEFFAPPPSQGTSGAYAMKQEYSRRRSMHAMTCWATASARRRRRPCIELARASDRCGSKAKFSSA